MIVFIHQYIDIMPLPLVKQQAGRIHCPQLSHHDPAVEYLLDYKAAFKYV